MPDDFTQEPRESDLVTDHAPMYAEEPGIKPGKPSSVTLAPCLTCGVLVLTGKNERGALVIVEPKTRIYALVWHSGERHPRAHQGRGYPEHVCKPAQ
jgi:hypothetical protein